MDTHYELKTSYQIERAAQAEADRINAQVIKNKEAGRDWRVLRAWIECEEDSVIAAQDFDGNDLTLSWFPWKVWIEVTS